MLAMENVLAHNRVCPIAMEQLHLAVRKVVVVDFQHSIQFEEECLEDLKDLFLKEVASSNLEGHSEFLLVGLKSANRV